MSLLLSLLIAGPAYDGEIRREIARQQCKGATEEADVVVCGRRGQDERYRMPGRDAPFDPAGTLDSVMRERGRWIEGGEAGIQSCGPVGPGGWTGCMVRDWNRKTQQSQWGSNRPTRRW